MLFLCARFHLQAQVNYVLNPSFEEYSHCPTNYDQVRLAKYWNAIDTTDVSTLCMPDYCNTCSTNTNVAIPNNGKFYQYPRTGNGVMQVRMLVDPTVSSLQPDVRDYLQGKLYQALTAGKTYCVTFYVSLEEISSYAIDKIGAYVDNGSIDEAQDSAGCAAPKTMFTPQVYATTIINDTLNWIRIQGSFTANGTEKFITIGNFFDFNNTDKVAVDYLTAPSPDATFYLVDDVSVIESDAVADAGRDTAITKGDSAHIGTNEEGMPCTWYAVGDSTPIGYGGGLWVKPQTTTSYVVQLDLCDHITYDTVTVYVCAGSAISTSSIKLCIGESAALSTATAGGTWSNDNAAAVEKDGATIKGLSTGIAMLTYYQPEGCWEITNVTVNDCGAVVVHDAITPNGDGINDTWVIETIQLYPNSTVQLYDKWGNRVYEKVNYSNDWNGDGLPDGTYYYLVKLNAPNLKGGRNVWSGSLLIKR